MLQRRACVKGPLSDEQVGTRHRGFHCLRMEKRSSEGSGARAMPGKVRCSWRGGSSQSAGDSMEGHLRKEHRGGSTWHRAGLREPKRTEGQGEMEAGGVGLLVAVSVQVSAQKSHFSGWPRAHAGHLHASCRVGTVGAGLQMCLGLAWCSLQRVRQGRSSSAGIGRVGQLARGGRWLAGVRSSARCRWSRGEAGSWRGIWLSCWRCTRGEREGGSRVSWVSGQD